MSIPQGGHLEIEDDPTTIQPTPITDKIESDYRQKAKSIDWVFCEMREMERKLINQTPQAIPLESIFIAGEI